MEGEEGEEEWKSGRAGNVTALKIKNELPRPCDSVYTHLPVDVNSFSFLKFLIDSPGLITIADNLGHQLLRLSPRILGGHKNTLYYLNS